MTEFKVGDRVRHKDFPDITGEVFAVERGFVCFTDDDGVEVGYRLKEVEHVHATEEDWEKAAWDLAEDGPRIAEELNDIKKLVERERSRMRDEEVRVVNASTGGEKGQKLARFDLIPVGPLWQVAELYGQGATKYEDRNWEKGYDWSLSYAALMRHATLFWGGEDADPKDGNSHLASVVFHALALMDYTVNHPELDDRPRKS